MKKQMSRGELLDLIEDSQEVTSEPWKWGTTQTFVCVIDGKNYMFAAQFHSQDGVQHYDGMTVDFTEVHQVERMVRQWEPVKRPALSEGDSRG